ncbi:hypothetical protein ACWGIR_32040 [Streptomyces albidoflavus]
MPTLTPVMTRAAEGDIAILRLRSSHLALDKDQPSLIETTEFLVTRVTQVTRRGAVAAVEDPRFDYDGAPLRLEHVAGVEQIFVIPSARIDVEAALAVARAHTLPGTTTPASYATLNEVREAINRFRHR